MATLDPTVIKGDTNTGALPRMAAYLYDRLTGGDDAVCQSAIASAELWVASVLARAGIEPDFDIAEVREAAILRTLYELYAYGDNDAIGRDKKKEALLMLQRKYGSSVSDDIADAGKSQQAAQQPGLAVSGHVAGRTDWNSF